jgi:hypothetical protein
MSFTRRVIHVSVVVLLALVATNAAADSKASDRIKELISGAAAANGSGDYPTARGQLVEAITLARENGLGAHALIAKSYVLMGVVLINESKDSKSAIRFFAKALDISPAIEVPPAMSTKAIKAAFDKAEDMDPPIADPELPAAPAGKHTEVAQAPSPSKDTKETKDPREAKREAAAAEAQRRQAEADARERTRQEQSERQQRDKEMAKLNEDLARTKINEGQWRAEREKLQQERAERDKQLGDAKGRVAQLERDYTERNKALTAANTKVEKLEAEKAERDKQLAAANARLQLLEKEKVERDKQLAAATARLQLLEKEKPERDREIADLKAHVQQLDKEKAERDKWVATAKDAEKKTHEANEKLERALSQVAARDRERRDREELERREREKALEGPDLPGHIAQSIQCTLPDEIPSETDLFVHCVPKPGIGAKVLALYYRPSGVAVFNSLVLERSRKGWFVGTIPANKVRGKMLQYYVEAHDAKDGVAAANGKPGSPNVLTIKPSASR